MAAAIAALTVGIVLKLRAIRYDGHFNYDRSNDFVVAFARPDGQAGDTISLTASLPDPRDGCISLDLTPADARSLLLELNVRTSLLGRWFDPSLILQADGFHDVQYVERGARGARFFNLSRLLATQTGRNLTVRLRGQRLSWDPKVRLHFCPESLFPEDRTLVLAPHPDDAEIAAFGVYSASRATVVTVTVGDGSARYETAAPLANLSPAEVAKLRVWDSITIPQLFGVEATDAVNLCYPDGRLGALRSHPEQVLPRAENGAPDYADLRRLNHSPLVKDDFECSWRGLIADLRHILETLRPTVIVTPDPRIDRQPDHVATTAALFEAMRLTSPLTGRFFFACIHNHHTEQWPFGPAGSGVTLAPMLAGDDVVTPAFYSHGLSSEAVRWKYVALEAMHDIREMEPPSPSTRRFFRRQLSRTLHILLDGSGPLPPTSYLRRAVRPDELFLVAPFSAADDVRMRAAIGLEG